MKYLKLYEGFDSNRVSAILSFLNKKIDNKDYDTEQFLKVLKKLADKFDFPLSTLSDKEIQYLPVNKALTVGKGEEAMNPSGTYCIKYWFSLEKGYLCSTGTGNKTMDYNKYNSYGTYRMSNEEGLDQSHLAYLSREYGIGGVITPARLGDLTTGDKVVMVCGDDFNGDPAYLTFGEIYADNRRNDDELQYYFYQNDNEGSDPGTTRNNIVLPDRYNLYAGNAAYRYAWSLGSAEDPSDDHCMIHKVMLDEKPLRFRDQDLDKMNKTEESVWDFNLPLDGTTLEEWTGRKTQIFNKVSKEANFAIVLFLDDVLVKDISKEEISKERKDMRKDALALMSNEDVKKANVKRYLEKLFDKLGIEKDKQELKNLDSVVKSTILGEYFLMLNFDSSFISRLTDFIRALYKVMSKDDEEYYFSSLVDIFKRIKKKRLDQSTLYTKNIKYIKSLKVDNIDKVNEILRIFLKIGKSASDYFNDKEVNSIEDLKSIQLQLRMILDLSVDDIFYLSGFMSNLLASLDETPRDVERRMLRTYSDEDYEKDIKKLEKLEVIINRDFLKK
jgi:hypothetical protein